MGIKRSRTAIDNWVQKANLQPTSTQSSNYIAVDETVIQLGTNRYWLYGAADAKTNQFLHLRLSLTTNSGLTLMFLRELREKHDIDNAVFLIDDAGYIKAALSRLGLRFHISHHGNRNAVEHIFQDVKQQTSLLSNTFCHVKPLTAESWLEAFAV